MCMFGWFHVAHELLDDDTSVRIQSKSEMPLRMQSTEQNQMHKDVLTCTTRVHAAYTSWLSFKLIYWTMIHRSLCRHDWEALTRIIYVLKDAELTRRTCARAAFTSLVSFWCIVIVWLGTTGGAEGHDSWLSCRDGICLSEISTMSSLFDSL